MDLDPVIIIKALNVAVLVVIGGALYVFWRASGRQPFLLHWSLYEFALAATVVVDGHMLLASLGVGIAVPLLLLGVIGYRQHKEPPGWAFLLLLAAVAVPAFTLAELFSKTYGLTYLVVAISIAYLAAAALFLREGGPL
jgi:hypothetical protein